MMSEQHQGKRSGYYSLHNQVTVFGDIAFWPRFYEFHDLGGSHDDLINSMLDIKCVGNIEYTGFFEPPSIYPDVEEAEANFRTIATSASLDLWPVSFPEKYNFIGFRELLKKFFTGESVCKMSQEVGRQLSVSCPASEIGGKLVVWLPKNPDICAIDFLIDLPAVDCFELRAGIVSNDKRLTLTL